MTMSPDAGRHLRHASRRSSGAGWEARPATGGSTSRGSTSRTSFGPSQWLIDHDEIEGAVNIASPHPAAQRGVHAGPARGAGMRSACRRREWMLEIGAVFMRTETELILKSRRVVPGRLLEAASFSIIRSGRPARDLCQRSEVAHQRQSTAA